MSTYTQNQIATLAASVGFKDIQMASAIAMAESGGRTDVISPAGDVGLWQINIPAHPQYSVSQMSDPLQNAKAAFTISQGGLSWRPWCTAYSDGACGTRGGSYQGSGSPYLKYMSTSVIGSSTGAVAQKAPVPLWCQPFMAQSQAWWEANSHHYPKDWASAEGGVDWTPQPNNSSTKITALLPGVVVGSGYFCKDGSSNQFARTTYVGCTGAQGFGVVTVRSNNPYPDLVPGNTIDIYYQHIIIDPSIGLTITGRSGQNVSAGQVLGSANGSFNIEVGINVGTEWGAIWGGTSPGPHVDPIPYLYRLISSGDVGTSGTVGVGSSLGGSAIQIATSTILTTSEQAYQLINDVKGFQGICEALDMVEQFVPFTLPTKAQQDVQQAAAGVQDFTIYGWDTGVVNPFSVVQQTQAVAQLPADGIQAVLVFVTTNFTAFAIRSLFVIAGMILAYALLINLTSKFVDVKDIGKIAETAMAFA